MKNLKFNIKTVIFLCSLFIILKGNAQQLETLINDALKNNLEIKKFDYQHKIASEKIHEVNSLPNTEFNLGVMAISPEMNMPMQRFKVSVMQMLPWFGTISARKNYATTLAEAEFVEVTIAKRKLVLSVSQLYYQLYEINAKQKVLDKSIELLKHYERLALTALEVSKASAVDVLKLQIRQNELNQEKAVLIQQYNGIQAAINSKLNRSYNTKVTIESSPEIPEEDTLYEYETLALNPELLKYDKLYQSVELSELLNQKEKKPMIGVGLEYINQESNGMITSPFKDMIMPMVSITLPIFNKKYTSQTKQNELQKKVLQFQKDDRLNGLKADLSKAISLRNQSRIKFNTQSKNLKQAKNVEEIILKKYETGTINFNDILDIQELQLKFQINQIEAIKTYYLQTTIINYLKQ